MKYVSQNKQIKVDDVETFDADFDNKTGLLTWKINLQPKESVTKQIGYEVRYPKEKRINLN